MIRDSSGTVIGFYRKVFKFSPLIGLGVLAPFTLTVIYLYQFYSLKEDMLGAIAVIYAMHLPMSALYILEYFWLKRKNFYLLQTEKIRIWDLYGLMFIQYALNLFIFYIISFSAILSVGHSFFSYKYPFTCGYASFACFLIYCFIAGAIFVGANARTQDGRLRPVAKYGYAACALVCLLILLSAAIFGLSYFSKKDEVNAKINSMPFVEHVEKKLIKGKLNAKIEFSYFKKDRMNYRQDFLIAVYTLDEGSKNKLLAFTQKPDKHLYLDEDNKWPAFFRQICSFLETPGENISEKNQKLMKEQAELINAYKSSPGIFFIQDYINTQYKRCSGLIVFPKENKMVFIRVR